MGGEGREKSLMLMEDSRRRKLSLMEEIKRDSGRRCRYIFPRLKNARNVLKERKKNSNGK